MEGSKPYAVLGTRPKHAKTTDLKTIINWIAHPFELNELILKPKYL